MLEHILQMARNHIDDVTGYDFINDFTDGGTEIYTYGNYMCSSYDYSTKAIEELKNVVLPYREQLLENQRCKYFLGELEISG